VILVTGVVFRMTQLILVVDFELLWRLGSVVDLTRLRLIFPRTFIVAVIVIIRGTVARVIGESFNPRIDHLRSYIRNGYIVRFVGDKAGETRELVRRKLQAGTIGTRSREFCTAPHALRNMLGSERQRFEPTEISML
jgi:hypothetical protein